MTNPTTYAIVNAAIDPVLGDPLPRGTLVIAEGRIAALGRDLPVPPGATVIDAGGRPVTPGIIDAHSHAGLSEDGFDGDADYNEAVNPIAPQLMAIDAFKPTDLALWEGLLAGVTTVCITPGSANVMGGMVAVVKTWAPRLAEQIVVPCAGLKMATGENPKRVFGGKDKEPRTRMGIAALIRQTFSDAQHYLAKKAAGGKPDEPFKQDLRYEALERVLSGELPVRCHAHRAIDMLTFMRIAAEHRLRFVFEHATEAEDILDELAAARVPLIMGPLFGGKRTKLEVMRRSFRNPVRAVAAGLTVALTTDHGVNPQYSLQLIAALCVREGMDPRAALRCITAAPAQILGLSDRYGALAPGMHADVLVWSGDPLDVRSRPERIFVEGRLIDPAADRGRITGILDI